MTITHPTVAVARDRCAPRPLPASTLVRLIAVGLALAVLGIARGQSEPDAAMLERLRTERTDLHAYAEDLQHVLEDLRDRLGVNLVADWRALRDLGEVDPRTRIDLSLTDVPIATALDLLLVHARVSERVGWTVRDGVIVIGRVKATENTILRLYDVRDFIQSGFTTRRVALTPVVALEPSGLELIGGETAIVGRDGGGGGFGSENGSLFGQPDVEISRGDRMERIQELVDLLQATVDTGSWTDFGGDLGDIREHRGSLIVRQTLQAHAEIESFLTLLRSSRARPIAVDLALVEWRADLAATWRADLGPSFPLLDEPRAAVWFESAERDGVLMRATGVVPSGTVATFHDLRQRDVRAGLQPVFGPRSEAGPGAVAAPPRVRRITSGLEAAVLALPIPGEEAMRVEVQLAWIPDIQRLEAEAGSGTMRTALDLVGAGLRQAVASVRIVPGTGVAITIPTAPQDDGLERDRRETFLVLRVRELPARP